jgi:hypothetical protein
MTVVPYQGSKIRTKRLAVAGKVTADEAIIGELKITGTTNEFQLRNNNLQDNVNNSCLVQLADGETTLGAPASKAIKFTQGGVTRASLGTDGNWDFNRPIDVNGNLTVTNGTATVGGVQLGSTGSNGIIFNTTNTGNLRFATSDSNNNLVEKVQLQNSGRLVVGHDFASHPAAPSGSELFHNAGTSRLVGDTTIDGAAILNDGLTLTGEIISNGDIKSGTSNDLVLECQKSNGEIKFLTDTGQKANITSAGALCINTVAPTGTEKLNVNGNVNVTGDIDLTGEVSTTTLQVGGPFNLDSAKFFVNGDTGLLGNVRIYESGIGERAEATLRTFGGDSGIGVGSVLEIDPSPADTTGNKGTVNIEGNLDVKATTTINGNLVINKAGDAAVQAKIFTSGADSAAGNNSNTVLHLDPEPFLNEHANGIVRAEGIMEVSNGVRQNSGLVEFPIEQLHNSGYIQFKTGGADKMRLTNSGRLVIGAADPIGSEKLYVDGDTTLMGNVFIRKANDHTVCATLKVTGSDGDATLIIDPEPFATGSDGTDSDTKPAGGTVVIRGALNVDGATGLPPDGAPPNLVAKLGVAELRSYAFTLAGLPQNSFWIMGHRDLDLNNNSAWFKDAAIAQQATGEVWFASKTASTTNSAPSFRFRDGSIGTNGTTVLQYYNSGGSTWEFASDVTVTGEVTINDKLTVTSPSANQNVLYPIADLGYWKFENLLSGQEYAILRHRSMAYNEAALTQYSSGATTVGSKASQIINFTQGGTTRGQVNTDGSWTFNTGVTMPFTTVSAVITNSVASTANLSLSCANGSSLFFGRSGVSPEFKMNTDGTFSFLNDVTFNTDVTMQNLRVSQPHSNYFMLRHKDLSGVWSSQAALMQTNTGATIVQCAHNQTFSIRRGLTASPHFEDKMVLNSSGTTFTFNTAVTVTGTFTNSSDDRLKINEQPLLGALSVIRQIKPQSYLKLKDETDLDGSFNVGVIAQELYQIPELQFAVKVPDEPTRMEDNFVKETVQETVTEYEEVTETITEIEYQDVTETITKEDLSGNISYHVVETQKPVEVTRDVVTQNPVEVTRDVEKEVNRPYEVTNYWSVDYNALSVYNIAAVKELDSTVRELSGLVLSHKAEIKSLMERIAALEAN